MRKKLNLSQEKFAELVGLSWKTIVNIESSKHFPKTKNLDKICKKLNIEYFELFIENQNKISHKGKIAEINSIISSFNETQLENIYKIIKAFEN